MRAIAPATEIVSLGCVASIAVSVPVSGEMLHPGMVDTGAADLDVNVRRHRKARTAAGQRDRRRRFAPFGRRCAVGRYPNDAVGFAAFDQAAAVEEPRIVLRKSAPESGPHRQSGHPAAGLQDADRIVGGAKRQAGEAGRRVQIVHHAAQHLDGESIERGGRPDGNAKSRGFESGGHPVERA